MRHLLDTCVVSGLIKPKSDPTVIKTIRSLDEQKMYLSIITIGEIRHGIELLKNSPKKQKLLEWLTDDLELRFRGKLICF